MKTAILSASLLFVVGSPSALAHTVPSGRAAELALHRLERLVILKKIDASFQTKFRGLELSVLPHQTEEDPVFQATLSQLPGADTLVRKLEIFMNGEGKALRHNVVAGNEAAAAPAWPDKDPVTLAETALHCVEGEMIENSHDCMNNTALARFNSGLTALSISQEIVNGTPIAVVDARSKDTPALLRIRLTMAGALAPVNPIEIRGE